MNTEPSNTNLLCPWCGHQYELFSHFVNHKGEVYTCDTCKKPFRVGIQFIATFQAVTGIGENISYEDWVDLIEQEKFHEERVDEDKIGKQPEKTSCRCCIESKEDYLRRRNSEDILAPRKSFRERLGSKSSLRAKK